MLASLLLVRSEVQIDPPIEIVRFNRLQHCLVDEVIQIAWQRTRMHEAFQSNIVVQTLFNNVCMI